jgi:hypothetical protein
MMRQRRAATYPRCDFAATAHQKDQKELIPAPSRRAYAAGILSHAEGRLISVSRCGAGSGGRGMAFRWRCGEAARRSKPRSARPVRRRVEGPDGRYGRRLVRSFQPECLVLNGRRQRKRLNGRLPGTFAEQTYKHRARDALGLADLWLCSSRASQEAPAGTGLRQASMSRGVEARGSEHLRLRILRKLEYAPDPRASRAPSAFIIESGRLVAPKPARAKAEKERRAYPGPRKQYGRWRVAV